MDKIVIVIICHSNGHLSVWREPGTGHGLDNVRQRVAYRYGQRARVEAGARDGRFCVRVQLPETP